MKIGRHTPVIMDGHRMTLFEVSKKFDIPYSTVRDRHAKGLELTKTHRRRVEIIDGKKVCKGLCGKLLPLSEFHLHGQNQGSSRHFNRCKTCRGREQYQRRLLNAWEAGDPSVVECEKCEAFMRKSHHKTCTDCRGTVGNRGSFERAKLTPEEVEKLSLKMIEKPKNCKSCGDEITMDNFVFGDRKKLYPRPQCCDCWSDFHALNNMMRKAKKDPDNHLQCNDCDRVFNIRCQGKKKKDGTPRLRTECPYCKSEEIERFLGDAIGQVKKVNAKCNS